MRGCDEGILAPYNDFAAFGFKQIQTQISLPFASEMVLISETSFVKVSSGVGDAVMRIHSPHGLRVAGLVM